MSKPRLVLDLSRLLSRAERLVPTGIDRVELAYAEHLIAQAEDRLDYAGMLSWGRFGRLSRGGARELVDALGRVWRSREPDPAGAARAARIARRLRVERFGLGGYGLGAPGRHGGRPVYVLVSHHHLDRPAIFEQLVGRHSYRFACLVHDLIPIEFPEYVRPGHDARHTVRMTTVARYADLVIVNSVSTATAIQPFIERAGRAVPVLAAPLGTDLLPRDVGSVPVEGGAPYFVCVGTIEARKNHLLLLQAWRRIATALGPAAPKLVLIGQRGWENEMVIDMIERCPAIQGVVTEENGLSDPAVARLIAGARALLLPSFAEGYGLPLAEALALGAPVLCSDVPAFREVGGDVPEYLDPIDGLGWHAAILDYADAGSARRRAQLERLKHWKTPGWADHFALVDPALDALGR